eukprot:6180815-Pleurochrysis_carterae.AAC.2
MTAKRLETTSSTRETEQNMGKTCPNVLSIGWSFFEWVMSVSVRADRTRRSKRTASNDATFESLSARDDSAISPATDATVKAASKQFHRSSMYDIKPYPPILQSISIQNQLTRDDGDQVDHDESVASPFESWVLDHRPKRRDAAQLLM